MKIILFKIRIIVYLIIIYSTNSYSSSINYKNIKENLTQLENISKAHSECLIKFQRQLLSIEQDIAILRGKIQYNEHQLLKIIEQQKNIIQKIDYFKNQQSHDLNNINSNAISNIKSINGIPNMHNSNNQNSNSDYNKAVNLVLEKKQYEQAIQAFQTFILKYPHSMYQANAHYWLGQLNYRKGNKYNASYHFALVAKKYPKSSKAPDSLLKVGIIMQENGDNEKAKFIYKQVNNLYPNSDAAKKIQKKIINY